MAVANHLRFQLHGRPSGADKRITMPSRCVAALIAIAALTGSIGLAQAQSDNERQQMLFGGAPRAKNFNFFGLGGTDATRTKVSYSGAEKPGTIVVNTAERK